MIRIEKIKTKDFYETMVDWCKGNNFAIISPSILPEYTFVVYNSSNIPTYSVCFYNTDSNLAWIGWELKNPTVKKQDKQNNLVSLFNHIEQYAKSQGYQLLFTTSSTKPIVDTLLGLGYKEGDVNVNHYLKIL